MKTTDNKIIKKGNIYYWVYIYPQEMTNQSCPYPFIERVRCNKITKCGEYVDFDGFYCWRNFKQKVGNLIFSDKQKAFKIYRKAMREYIEFLEQQEDEIISKIDIAKQKLEKTK